MAIKLYGALKSPFAARCRLHAYAKGLDFELIDAGGEMSPAEKRAFNPTGKAPFIIDNGRVVLESDVICEYFEEAYPDTPLLPAGPADRAAARMTAQFANLYVLQRALPLVRFLRATDHDPSNLQNALSQLREGLTWLDELSRGRSGILNGERVAWADCVLVPAFATMTILTDAVGAPDLLAGQGPLSDYWLRIQDNDQAQRVVQEMTTAIKARLASLSGGA